MDAEGDVVVSRTGRGVEVDVGLNAHRIGKGDFAALQIVARAGNLRTALCYRDAPEQRGRGQSAAQPQIHIARKLGIGILEVELRRTGHMDVEQHTVRWCIGRGHGVHGIGLGGECGKVKVGADDEARDDDIACEGHAFGRALQAHRGIGQ